MREFVDAAGEMHDAWLTTQGTDPTPFAAEVAGAWRALGGT